jgi:hypothetical protein
VSGFAEAVGDSAAPLPIFRRSTCRVSPKLFDCPPKLFRGCHRLAGVAELGAKAAELVAKPAGLLESEFE